MLFSIKQRIIHIVIILLISSVPLSGCGNSSNEGGGGGGGRDFNGSASDVATNVVQLLDIYRSTVIGSIVCASGNKEVVGDKTTYTDCVVGEDEGAVTASGDTTEVIADDGSVTYTYNLNLSGVSNNPGFVMAVGSGAKTQKYVGTIQRTSEGVVFNITLTDNDIDFVFVGTVKIAADGSLDGSLKISDTIDCSFNNTAGGDLTYRQRIQQGCGALVQDDNQTGDDSVPFAIDGDKLKLDAEIAFLGAVFSIDSSVLACGSGSRTGSDDATVTFTDCVVGGETTVNGTIATVETGKKTVDLTLQYTETSDNGDGTSEVRRVTNKIERTALINGQTVTHKDIKVSRTDDVDTIDNNTSAILSNQKAYRTSYYRGDVIVIGSDASGVLSAHMNGISAAINCTGSNVSLGGGDNNSVSCAL